MNTRTAVLSSLALIAGICLYTLLLYPRLPDTMPIHWDLHGKPNGWMGKSGGVLFGPGVMLVMFAFQLGASRLSPRDYDVDAFRPAFNYLMVLVAGLFGFIQVIILHAALNASFDSGKVLIGGLMLFMAAVGNLMGKVRRNFWVGVRTPWTLASDRVWNATHRLAARLMVAAGLLGAVAIFLGAPIGLVFGVFLALILYPVLYSYLIYRRLEGNGPGSSATVLLLLAFFLVAARSQADTAREVTFKGAGDLVLKGTLLLPNRTAERTVPAVLLLPGSGPPDRDGNVKPIVMTDILKQIAERLAKEGIASLRYDKRSSATYATLWSHDLKAINEFFRWENFVEDAKQGMRFLRSQPEIDGKRVGLLGHSEGGSITLQIVKDWAGRPESPAAIVLAATVGRSMADVIHTQVAEGMPRQGATPALTKEYVEFTDRAIAQLRKDETIPNDVPVGLRSLFNPPAAKLIAGYIRLDPVAQAKAYSGPVLIIQGARDLQVSATRDAPLLQAAFQARPRGSVDVMIVPGASHNFKTVTSDSETGFTGPVVPAALEKIATWLKAKLKK